MSVTDILLKLWNDSGFSALISGFLAEGGWQNLVMLIIGCVLLYLAIVKKFEPLLLCGIAFGCILTNLPGAGLYNQELWTNFMTEGHEAYHSYGTILKEGGLLDFFYIGVKAVRYQENGNHSKHRHQGQCNFSSVISFHFFLRTVLPL